MSLLQSLYHGAWLRSVDFSLAKSLQRAREETPDWVLAAAALASRAVANGHSQLPLAQVSGLLLEVANDREPPSLPALEPWLQVLRASPWVATAPSPARAVPTAAAATTVLELDGRVLVLEGEALSLRRYWNYEVRLAAAISARLAARPSNFLLLTGGPGTGKTTTVARMLIEFAEHFSSPVGAASAATPPPNHAAPTTEGSRRGTTASRHPRILLAAPTGKAAARLAESVRENLAQLRAVGTISAALAHALPNEAKTLHRLLGWQRGSVEFRHNAAHPLSADLVIVDEASMIDLPLMCKLFEAMPSDATLILIGDRDQLPSVETGDVLATLCDAVVAPHRVHLTHSHRQGSDIDVGGLANLVRDGEVVAAISGLEQQHFRGISWQQGSDRALADAVLAQALPAYRALQSASDVAAALTAARRFRVLTAVREGGAGSHTLNAMIASALDPARRGDGFFRGRLVLINENSYRQQLFNGDIGIVWPDELGELRVWFDAEGGPRAWLPAALPAHESAFALTVHKSQGSEFDCVFLALPECGARVISRELVYTGLTRCKREVTLWASEAVLREAIGRKAQRWSGLASRLARS